MPPKKVRFTASERAAEYARKRKAQIDAKKARDNAPLQKAPAHQSANNTTAKADQRARDYAERRKPQCGDAKKAAEVAAAERRLRAVIDTQQHSLCVNRARCLVCSGWTPQDKVEAEELRELLDFGGSVCQIEMAEDEALVVFQQHGDAEAVLQSEWSIRSIPINFSREGAQLDQIEDKAAQFLKWCEDGELEALAEHLQIDPPHRMHILSRDAEHRTALMVAIKHSQKEVCALLMDHPAVEQLVRAVDVLGRHALHYAVLAKDLELVTRLLKCGAPCSADLTGATPLHLAVAPCCEGAPLSPGLEDCVGSTQRITRGTHEGLPLRHCPDAVVLALAEHCDIASLNSSRQTAQHIALQTSDPVPIVGALGVDDSCAAVPDCSGDTCMHIAMKHCNYQVVELLFSNQAIQAILRTQNANHDTPVSLALRAGAERCLGLMLMHGGRVRLESDLPWMAEMRSRLKIVEAKERARPKSKQRAATAWHSPELRELIQCDTFSDLDLVDNAGGVHPAHGALLAFRSRTIRAVLLTEGFAEKLAERPRVNVDLSADALREMLEFLYTGALPALDVLSAYVTELYPAAQYFQCPDLLQHIDEVFIEHLSLELLASVVNLVSQRQETTASSSAERQSRLFTKICVELCQNPGCFDLENHQDEEAHLLFCTQAAHLFLSVPELIALSDQHESTQSSVDDVDATTVCAEGTGGEGQQLRPPRTSRAQNSFYTSTFELG